jgi:hypothetical protein
MAQIEEFVHHQPLGGSDDADTAIGAAEIAADTPALTPLMLDATKGLLMPWDGANAGTAIGVLALNVTAGQSPVTYYKSGTFRTTDLLWPAGLSAEQKLNAFVGSAVSVN